MSATNTSPFSSEPREFGRTSLAWIVHALSPSRLCHLSSERSSSPWVPRLLPVDRGEMKDGRHAVSTSAASTYLILVNAPREVGVTESLRNDRHSHRESPDLPRAMHQIGRASCRERVQISAVA